MQQRQTHLHYTGLGTRTLVTKTALPGAVVLRLCRCQDGGIDLLGRDTDVEVRAIVCPESEFGPCEAVVDEPQMRATPAGTSSGSNLHARQGHGLER